MANKDPRLKRAGVSGYNKPKATQSQPTKSHVVAAKEGKKVKVIRCGQPSDETGTESNHSPARGKKRAADKARHASNSGKDKKMTA